MFFFLTSTKDFQYKDENGLIYDISFNNEKIQIKKKKYLLSETEFEEIYGKTS